MTLKPKKFARPITRMPNEDADSAGSARICIEVDAGVGQHVTFDIKIAVQRRNACDFAPVSANWRRRPLNSRMSICPTSSRMIRNMGRTSTAFSDQFVCADPSGGGEVLAVADEELSRARKIAVVHEAPFLGPSEMWRFGLLPALRMKPLLLTASALRPRTR